MINKKQPLYFRKKKNIKNKSSITISLLIPNLITIISLCLGLSAVRCGLHHKFIEAATLILIAAVLDGIDGRVARLLNSTSNFGAQLDSLADFANFGIAPSLLIYIWTNSFYDVKGIDWALVIFFSVCMAIRLARFNASLTNHDKRAQILAKYFFTGVPAPAGALLAILPMFLYFQFGYGFYSIPQNVIAYCATIAILVASRIPTISFKKISINRDFISITFIIICLLIISLIIEPWITLVIFGLIYILSIPVTVISFFKIELRNLENIKNINNKFK